MKRVIVTDDFIIINSPDGMSQQFIEVNEESDAYQQIKADTNDFTNLDFPPTILLSDTDAGMSRVLEDLISILINKGTITLEDLPIEARQKLDVRVELRSKL